MKTKTLIIFMIAGLFFCGCNTVSLNSINNVTSQTIESRNTFSTETGINVEMFVNAVRENGEYLKQTMEAPFVEEAQFGFYDINSDGNMDLLWSIPNWRQYDVYLFINTGEDISCCEIYMQSYCVDEQKIYPTVDCYVFADKVLLKTESRDISYNVFSKYCSYYYFSEGKLAVAASLESSWKEENKKISDKRFFLEGSKNEPMTQQEYDAYNESFTKGALSHERIELDNHVENYLSGSELAKCFNNEFQ